MAQSNLTLCYEGIQRVYRNAIVRHLRSSLTKAYPDDYAERLRKPFLKEWDRIRADADARRKTGEIAAEVVDDFDLLSVGHFFNLFEAYYGILLHRPDATEKDRQSGRHTLLGWAKSVKDLRDPLSHPSEEDFSFEDSFSLLDCARRVLLRLNLTEDAEKIRSLTRDLAGSPLKTWSETEPLEDTLPPRESIVVDFVGRESELKRLKEWFDDPISKRWALAGEGGKGKSAVAFKFATEIKFAAPEPFQVVHWLSAKKRRFSEGNIVEIQRPEFVDFDSALSRLLIQYGWSDEIGNSLELKRERVLQLLNEFPALVIIDDIDALQGQAEEAIEFFTYFAPSETKSKFLLTSRLVLFGMATTTSHISGLNPTDAREFITSRSSMLELDLAVVEKLVPAIIEATEASPLYMESLLRLITTIPSKTAIKLWRERAGDDAREYALRREFDTLSERARYVCKRSPESEVF